MLFLVDDDFYLMDIIELHHICCQLDSNTKPSATKPLLECMDNKSGGCVFCSEKGQRSAKKVKVYFFNVAIPFR